MTTQKQSRPHQVAALSKIAEAVKLIVNLPTGSGKSLIQSRAIAEAISTHTGVPGVYVILTPRILLSNQLYQEVKMDLALKGIDAQYLIVNSGGKSDKSDRAWFDAIRNIEQDRDISYRELPSTTSIGVIKETWLKAQREEVPLVIIGNYHSASKIVGSGIPVNDLYCDEAHNLVPGAEEEKDFSRITTDWFKADRKFYFTATMKYTNGDFGMNNVERFGEAFSMLPVELINAGELVRPRMHLIEMKGLHIEDDEADEADVQAVLNAFEEHRAMLVVNSSRYIAPKMLVVAKGSKHMDFIANHPDVLKLLQERDGLRIFDISSHYGPRINGDSVSREEFLKTLQSLSDHDEAIIIHVRILSEGIDVPGITGIMPLNNLQKSTFLQTLGRATRLHPEDRKRLYAELIGADELKKFVKPYAWIILPTYGDLGTEISEDLAEIVRELRTFGFNPSEDIFIKVSKGQPIPKSTKTMSEEEKKLKPNLSILVFAVNHLIEEEDVANAIEHIQVQAASISTEEELFVSLSKIL
jgi:superfamily II DNA or RNA helicase